MIKHPCSLKVGECMVVINLCGFIQVIRTLERTGCEIYGSEW
ncbi:hypothetical protein [Candidatus Hodgkinia cicadicola]